ncbi:MAG: hypothetical protein K8S16_00595 [Bacteroidales bacterium]|nr:hypothetical protein [Bacteroidales bacterium]
MLKFYSIFFVLILTCVGCSKKNVAQIENSIINTKHLEHLYEEIEVDSIKLGTIWIYSDAPDYQLVTDEDEGYTCVDDVARALVFYCRQYKTKPVNSNLEKIKSLSRFVLYMQAPNGYYYNFMFPDKQINTTHQNSKPTPNFWSWRAYWALSELCLINSTELSNIQEEAKNQLSSLTQKIDILFQVPYEVIEIEGLTMSKWMEDYGADQISVILLGLTNYYKINPDENVKSLVQRLGESIISVQYGSVDTFPYSAFLSWKNVWHAWGSAQSYALLKAGNELNIEGFVTHALKEIDNFYPYCLEQGFLHEFYIKMESDSIQTYNLKKFPQIAYSISPMILASIEAFQITKSEKYAVLAGEMGSWFFGNNAANQVMYNTSTGRVFDGMDSENNVNHNSGAESTIEALLSLQAIETSSKAVQILKANM